MLPLRATEMAVIRLVVAPNRNRWVCCDVERAQTFEQLGLRAAIAAFQAGRGYDCVVKVQRPLCYDEAAEALDVLQGLVVCSETMVAGVAGAKHKYVATMRGVAIEHAPRELRDEREVPVVRWWSYGEGKWCYARSLADISTDECARRTAEELRWIGIVLGEVKLDG